MTKAERKAIDKAAREHRASVIESLGWEPEDGTFAGGYASRTAELEQTLAARKRPQESEADRWWRSNLSAQL